MTSFSNHKLQNSPTAGLLSLGFSSQLNQMQKLLGNHQSSSLSSAINTHVASHEMKPTEDLLASEFNKLPIHEQKRARDDLDGAGRDLDPSPDMMEMSLAQLELQLKHGNFATYDVACQQNRSYVEDRSLRLKFLRANFYDVSRSANQMVNFLGQKATYFGIDKVAEDITLDDLNEEDFELMLSGFFHVQNGTDKSGRVIVYMFNHLLGKYKVETVLRVNFYIWFNILLPMPTVEQKGVVAVYWDHLSKTDDTIVSSIAGLQSLPSVVDYVQSVPIRYSAMHICTKAGTGNANLNNVLIGTALNALPPYTRARAKIHHGNTLELLDQLRGYGFPETFPVDDSGNLRTGLLNTWLHLHMANDPYCIKTINRVVVLEQRSDSDVAMGEDETGDLVVKDMNGRVVGRSAADFMGSGILFGSSNRILAQSKKTGCAPATPSNANTHQRISADHTEKDVLLGRGRDIQNHIGNIRFRDFLQAHQDEYDDAPRNQRRQIASNLYKALKADGIRFWQKAASGEWEEVSSGEGEKKIGQLFRTLRKKG